MTERYEKHSEANGQPHSSRLSARTLWVVGLAPALLTLAAWLWFFAAWRFLSDVSRGTVEQQKRALFWASDLPLSVFGGATLILAIVVSLYLVARKRGWLAVPLCIYYAVAAIVIGIGSVSFVPFKPPGW